jgi:hypothetical protein
VPFHHPNANTAQVREDGPASAEELEQLYKEIETSVAARGVVIPSGRTGVTVRRLNLDPVTSYHRPFIYYAVTATFDATAALVIRAIGEHSVLWTACNLGARFSKLQCEVSFLTYNVQVNH